jgi:transposase
LRAAQRDEPFHLAALGTPGRQIAALVGAALSNHVSGKMNGTRAILAVAPDARDALYVHTGGNVPQPGAVGLLPSLACSRREPEIAFTMCMRKLLIVLNAMVRHQTICNPEFGGVPLNLPDPFPIAVGDGGGAVAGFAFKL